VARPRRLPRNSALRRPISWFPILPGKGTWYRVRVGDFATAKDAYAGKLAFEKKHGVIAYVAQR